jgi:hypothetical protein
MSEARYFRAARPVYESACQQLDAAYGYPNPATFTQRSLPLPDALATDEDGRVYLKVLASFCDYILPSEMLPQLIASGAVEEITAEQYEAVLPPLP